VIASSCPAWLWSPMLPIWLSLIAASVDCMDESLAALPHLILESSAACLLCSTRQRGRPARICRAPAFRRIRRTASSTFGQCGGPSHR
jgi:hypothetical protein